MPSFYWTYNGGNLLPISTCNVSSLPYSMFVVLQWCEGAYRDCLTLSNDSDSDEVDLGYRSPQVSLGYREGADCYLGLIGRWEGIVNLRFCQRENMRTSKHLMGMSFIWRSEERRRRGTDICKIIKVNVKKDHHHDVMIKFKPERAIHIQPCHGHGPAGSVHWLLTWTCYKRLWCWSSGKYFAHFTL